MNVDVIFIINGIFYFVYVYDDCIVFVLWNGSGVGVYIIKAL